MKPQKGDYPEYAQKYLDLVDDDDIISLLEKTNDELNILLDNIPEEKGDYYYSEGKWTLKQVIGHLLDTDRIFAYRLLAIARGENQPLPSFDQDLYVVNGKFNSRTLRDLIDEYKLLRESNLALIKSLEKSHYQNRGIAAGNSVTVLGIMFMIAGHQKHHINIIKEKYLI
ncbi:MAG: DinB family protein [Ignavibacterium sp.]|nr:DinB family protein [Ignavibacterium sp.]MDW8376227.1 DinB family protein [Ignavibacteriales bacterium]